MLSVADKTAAIPIWEWTFHSVEQLRVSLEQYSERYIDGGPGDGGDPDAKERDFVYCQYAQNLAIDRAMTYIAAGSVYAWWLLDSYYRKGYHAKRRGWIAVAAALGWKVPRCPGPVRCYVQGDDKLDRPTCPVGRSCARDYERFQEELELAISALFFAVERRQEQTV